MIASPTRTSQIIRTERGLSIDGTRLTLYNVMDFVKADYPPHLIQDRLLLSDEQLEVALRYIDEHREEVEAEYAQILREAEADRRESDALLREHLAKQADKPRTPEQAALRKKFDEWQALRRIFAGNTSLNTVESVTDNAPNKLLKRFGNCKGNIQ